MITLFLVSIGGSVVGSIVTQIIMRRKDAYGNLEISSEDCETDKYLIKFDKFIDFRKKKRAVLHIKILD